jgi:hypothetical protein
VSDDTCQCCGDSYCAPCPQCDRCSRDTACVCLPPVTIAIGNWGLVVRDRHARYRAVRP